MTLRAKRGDGEHVPCVVIVFDARGNGGGAIAPTITGDHENRITDYTAIAVEEKAMDENVEYIVRRLTPLECTRLQGFPDGWVDLPHKQSFSEDELMFWNSVLLTKAIADGSVKKSEDGVYEYWKFVVPENEDEPGEWVNTHKRYKEKNEKQMLNWYNKMVDADSNKYKAIGNSIALPQWWWIFGKMMPYLKDKPKLGSLFDGIGGFPITFEEMYGKGTARWASEVEPFAIAVTKYHFPEEGK